MDEIIGIIRNRQFKKLFVGDTDNTLIQFFRYILRNISSKDLDLTRTSIFFW